MKFLNLYFLILFSVPLTLMGQDVHLTQYYTSNLSLNPAYTGQYDGDFRATLNSRNQWAQLSAPIKTNMISLEKKILRFPDEFGIGFIFINDQVSSSYLNTNKAFLSVSYQKNINKHFFRFGIQGGLILRRIDLGSQTLPEQWNYATGSYDQSFASGEGALQNSWSYPAFNAGLGWRHMFGKTMVSAGYGLFNLNKPQDKFLSAGQSSPFRHVFNASAAHYFTEKLWLTPHILYMNMAGATNCIVGANINKMLKENLGVLLGLGYRGNPSNSDAGIATAGFTYNRIIFGFSWDFNVSTLSKNSNSKSAWEISLSYTTPSRIHNKVTVPCDRY